MELVIFIGLQGSGKSSFFRERFAETHLHVSKDLMSPSARNKGRKQREQLERAFQEGRDVVVDNTHPSRADREALIAHARLHGAKVVGYFFDSSVRQCLARNAARTGRARVPDVAIFATAKKMERPSVEEGYDALYRVTLRSDDRGFEVTPLLPPPPLPGDGAPRP